MEDKITLCICMPNHDRDRRVVNAPNRSLIYPQCRTVHQQNIVKSRHTASHTRWVPARPPPWMRSHPRRGEPPRSSFASLPGEIRNMIYVYVCCKEWKFLSPTRIHTNRDAINLSTTCHQMRSEMYPMLLRLAQLHIYSWDSFVPWLCGLAIRQWAAITILYIHISIFLKATYQHSDFSRGEPSHTIEAGVYTTWPRLNNLREAKVYIHPHRSLNTPPQDPRLEEDKELWDARASAVASKYVGQLRLLHCKGEVKITGMWSTPVASERLGRMKGCWESGSLYREQGREWRCRSENCKALWETKEVSRSA
jgi:hypothetical protein